MSNQGGKRKGVLKKILTAILVVALLLVGTVLVLRYVNGKNNEKLSEVRQSSLDATKCVKGYDFKNPEKSKLKNTVVSKIDQGVVQGYHFKPNKPNGKQTVITFSGSEGGIDSLRSTFLAENGYDVYALYYFGKKNLNKELVEVELSIFEDMLKYVRSETRNAEKVTLIGSSKGAEMSLLLAQYYPDDVDSLVLYAPSAYVWPGLSWEDRTERSSWKYKGEPLKFLTEQDIGFLPQVQSMINSILNKPMDVSLRYDKVIEDEAKITEFLIPTDKLQAQVLMFAGGQDELWNCVRMGEMLREQLGAKASLHAYPEAGHVFFGPKVLPFPGTRFSLLVGGEYEANVAALIDSNELLLRFLK